VYLSILLSVLFQQGTALAGFSNFCASLSGHFINHVPYLVLILFAGSFISLAFISSSYVDYAWELYFSYSMLFGLGAGFISHLSLSIIIDIMESNDEIAFSLAVSNVGTGVGIIVISCTVAYLCNVHDILTVDELFRYMSLLGVLAMLSSFVLYKYIDPKHHSIRSNEENEELPLINEEGKTRSDLHGWQLLFSWEGVEKRVVHLFFSNMLNFLVVLIPFKFSIIFATSSLTDLNMYYYVSITVGTGSMLARILFPSLVTISTPFTVNKLLQLGCSIATTFLAFTSTDSTVLVLGSLFLYSLFNSHFPLVALRTMDIIGKRHHHANIGVQISGIGIGYIIGGYTSGWIYDATLEGGFKYLFLYCSAIFICSIIFDEIVFHDKSQAIAIFKNIRETYMC